MIMNTKPLTDVQKQSIRFISSLVFKSNSDPFRTPNGLDFLITHIDIVIEELTKLGRGVHTVQRYCNIMSRAINDITTIKDADTKRICKKRYLSIAALAKREYRLNDPKYKPKRTPKPTFILQKLKEFEKNNDVRLKEAAKFIWGDNVVRNYDVQYDALKRNMDNIINADIGKPIEDRMKILEAQLQEIENNSDRGRTCVRIANGSREEISKNTNYDMKIRQFMSEYNNGKSLVDLINYPNENITEKLKNDKTKNWGNKDSLLNAIKYYIGCSINIQALKNQGLDRPFLKTLLSRLEDFAKPYRKKWNKEKEVEKKKKYEDPYTYLVEKFGNFITWGRLTGEINRILKLGTETNYTLAFLMKVFTQYIPRRSSDYANMLVITDDVDENDLDNDNFNYLILNEKKKRYAFIFNYWKNYKYVGAQGYTIRNKNILDSIRAHLNNERYKKTRTEEINGKRYHYLLYLQNGNPIKKATQVVSQMDQIRKRWDIPYSIRHIRHSFSTWFIKKHKESNEKIAQLADQMGTSVKILMNVYYDARVVGQLHMDDDDDFSELTQIEEIFKKDIRK